MRTYGTITTPAGLPLSRRLYQLGTDMEELITRLKPSVIAIEELFFNTNITTGIAVAHGRGVLLYAAEKCGVPLYEYTPSQVKLAVTGYGKAEKRQVMDMTRRLLKLESIPRPDDAADALGLALCHARSFTSRMPQAGTVRETI
jgi:crossover junction endodeoxyribonuclease RuvC